MFDPFEVSRIGNIYCEERVLDAKNHRAVRRGRKNGISFHRAGDFLIAIGQKLKEQVQVATSISRRKSSSS